MIRELREARAANPDYPNVLFVYIGTVEQGEKFFPNHWKEAGAIADQDRTLFDAFGRKRGSLRELFGFRVWGPGLRSLLKGNLIGKPVGDPLVMPGVFVIRDRKIVYEHPMTHVGDHPNFKALGTMGA